MNRVPTSTVAKGKWRGILLELGASAAALTGKHVACPFCGGKDRFRWDNKEGTGSFICGQCGSGSGFEFLNRLKGWDFKTAAAEVDKVVGNVKPEPNKPKPDPDRQRRQKAELWRNARPIQVGDPVSLYFASRGLVVPPGVRFAPQCPVPDEAGMRPAMLAMVQSPEGKAVTIHRTFLTPQGRKADLPQPRAVMPGEIPDGSAIRLGPVTERMGIGEGIETAQAAAARFGVTAWAAINSTMLEKWIAPPEVKHLTIFGDNDPKFGGQAAAYRCAHRNAVKRPDLEIVVLVAPAVGTDWAYKEAA